MLWTALPAASFQLFSDGHTLLRALQSLYCKVLKSFLALSLYGVINVVFDVQAEVPSSVRAFWETGASHPGPLSTSISLDSNRAAGEHTQPLKYSYSRLTSANCQRRE